MKLFFTFLISNTFISRSPLIDNNPSAFDAAHDHIHDAVEYEVENTRNEEGHEAGLGIGDLFADSEQLLVGHAEGDGGVLHQGDHLIGDAGHNALDHLGQNDAQEGLELGIAQDAGGLILTHGHGINAAAVDFREVGGIVDGKGNDHGNEFIPGYAQVRKQIVRAIGDRQELQHQGSAAQNGDDKAHHRGHDLILAHAQQGKQHAKGQGKQQGQEENGAGIAQALAHFQDHGG